MFVGREKELEVLQEKIGTNAFEFGIVYGRRRIGKTFLLLEIVEKYNAIYYVANEMGAEQNLRGLSKAIADYYGMPFTFDSYEMIFQFLAKESKERQTILIIDEFTYLVEADRALMSVLQNAIDHVLSDSKLKLILSGSHVGMVEDALTYKKPLYGRTTFKLKIEPFDYFDAAKFYPDQDAVDKVRLYSVFGGVPFYLSRINHSLSVVENIYHLILDTGSIFENEIAFFLSQEVRSVATYGKVLNAIASGATRAGQIASKSGISSSGTTANYLDTLQTLGIVEKETCFGESSNSRKTYYRIKDQLFRFHYAFIENHRSQKAVMNPHTFLSKLIEPKLDDFVSVEFEYLCREFLKRKFSHTIQDLGRYWHNDARRKEDIEIDIVMKHEDRLTAFECKWTNKAVDQRVVNELMMKTNRLGDVQFGFFSKSGFRKNLKHASYLFALDDLYEAL